MKVSFLPEAESEHLKQVAYYEAQQTGLGARYLAEVSAALEYICEAPHRFHIARPPTLRRLGLKRFPFTIFFRFFRPLRGIEVDGVGVKVTLCG